MSLVSFHKEKKEILDSWGIQTAIDLFDCDPRSIRSRDVIAYYVEELCRIIDMKPFGACQIIHFGEDERVEGYSMVQLIETSLISGHFANKDNNAFIDIFSCKPYNTQDAIDFSRRHFLAQNFKYSVQHRG